MRKLKNRYLSALLILFFLTSCTTKKEVVYRDVAKTDTLRIKELVKVQAPVKDRIVISDLCDSLKNRPVKMRRIFVQNGDSLRIITNELNELIIESVQKEKELQRLDSIVSISQKVDVERKHVTFYRKDWTWIFAAFGLGFVLGLIRPWRFFLR